MFCVNISSERIVLLCTITLGCNFLSQISRFNLHHYSKCFFKSCTVSLKIFSPFICVFFNFLSEIVKQVQPLKHYYQSIFRCCRYISSCELTVMTRRFTAVRSYSVDECLEFRSAIYDECISWLHCCPVSSLLLDIQEVKFQWLAGLVHGFTLWLHHVLFANHLSPILSSFVS